MCYYRTYTYTHTTEQKPSQDDDKELTQPNLRKGKINVNK